MAFNRVTLIGFRASGKSTIGRLLAARLALPFGDADTEVEKRLGMPIAKYFSQHGEAAFRDQEEAALAALLAGPGPLVLATGGGVVLRPANRALLRARGGFVVYLVASVETIQDRLRHNAGGRPSLTGRSVVDEVPDQLAVRDPLYHEAADVVVPVGVSADEAVLQIELAMGKHGLR